MTEPVGFGQGGKPVWLGDIWPSSDEIHALMRFAMHGKSYRENYERIRSDPGPLWERIKGGTGLTYGWPAQREIRRRSPRTGCARACTSARTPPSCSLPRPMARSWRRPIRQESADCHPS